MPDGTLHSRYQFLSNNQHRQTISLGISGFSPRNYLPDIAKMRQHAGSWHKEACICTVYVWLICPIELLKQNRFVCFAGIRFERYIKSSTTCFRSASLNEFKKCKFTLPSIQHIKAPLVRIWSVVLATKWIWKID